MNTHEYLMSLSKDRLLRLLYLSEDLDNWDNESLLDVIQFDYEILYPEYKIRVIDAERMHSLNQQIGKILLHKFIVEYEHSK